MRNVYIYILVMAVVTYLVRVIPLVFFHREIKSRFIRSFLYYMPYVTLSLMIFPAMIEASGNITAGIIGFAVAIVVAFFKASLPLVACASCLAVYLSLLLF